MLGEDLLVRARTRLQQPAFTAAVERLRTDLREDLVRPLLVPAPDRPAGYYHDYFCPQHGVQLEFEWNSPAAHRCPVDGAIFRGEPYDRSWWWFVNHAHSEASFRLALGWRLLGDRACLDQLQALLAAYTAHYPAAGWPKDDPRTRKGKVTFHALDEAVWLIPLAWAYDLVRAALPAAAQREVETRLLTPAAEHLLAQRWLQVHNYMCWLNAGVAAAATLIGRDDLLTQVIDGPFGFHQQVAEGVLADGTWWEGSASYHFYTLAALLALVRSVEQPPLATSGRRDGALLRHHPKVRDMFLAPLRWSYPDLTLPAINDCWYHSSLVGETGHGIPPAAAFYELAAGWYGDTAFEAILTANYHPSQGPHRAGLARDSVEALLFGPDDIPRSAERRTPRLLTASAHLADFGVAVLRGPDHGRPSAPSVATPTVASNSGETRGADQRTFLLLKYGRHGGGHGHPDKLAIILAARGERLAPDQGTPGYGIALNDTWYRHTLSHNTVLLDGYPQPPATGRLLAFAPLPTRSGHATRRTGAKRPAGFGLIDTAVKWPADAHDALLGVARPATATTSTATKVYYGAKLRRLILFRPNYFLDVFTVSCPEPRQIEWAYHNRGQLTHFGPPARPAKQNKHDQHDQLEVPEPLRWRAALPGEDLLASFATGTARLDLWLGAIANTSQNPGAALQSSASSSWVIAADAPASPASETMPLILRRTQAEQAVFAAVFHPHGGQPSIRHVSWSQSGDTLRCEVQLQRSTDRWEVPLRERAAARLVTIATRAHRTG